jgi:hypothetical protein
MAKTAAIRRSRVPQNPRSGYNRATVGRHGMKLIGNSSIPKGASTFHSQLIRATSPTSAADVRFLGSLQEQSRFKRLNLLGWREQKSRFSPL